MVGYIFGGKDMPKSAQELKRLRATAAALAPSRTPQNVGEGLNAVGEAILYRSLMRDADQGEAAGTNAANNAFTALMRGGMGGAAPSMGAAPSAAPVAAPPGTMVPNQPPVPGLDRSPSQLVGPDGIDVGGTEAYIRQAAQARGIDPEVAVRVAKSEGLAPGTWQSNYVKNGKRETSYGPFQLLVGGGLGDKFQKIYGKSPEDPSTLQQQIDFALDEAAQGGWSPWYGAAKVGVGSRTGLEQARALGYQQAPAPTNSAEAVTAIGQGGQTGYVDPMVSTPNYRPQSSGAVAALANGPVEVAQAAPQRQGIMSALMGGPQPTASDMPADYFPPAPSQGGGIDMMQAQELLGNEFLPQGRRAALEALVASEQQRQQLAEEQRVKQSDPAYRLGLEKSQLELERLRNPGEKWKKLDDGTLFNPTTGETKDVSGGGVQPQGFRFGGTSVEAQALNGLMESGQITQEQAQQLGAGKTITGPNGEIIFLTPQGIFGQPAGGGAPQPIAGAAPSEPSIFPDGGTPAPAAPMPAAPVQPPQTGNIQITEPKVTLDEKKAMTFADRLSTSGDLIDQYGDAGIDKAEVMKSQIPFGIGNMIVGEDFQKFDQARRDFINAQLRRESGAVISDEEFDNANKQYFPQPGDGPDVLKQKAANRRLAIEGMVRDGGPTYKRPQSKKPVVDPNKPVSEMTEEELEALSNGD